MQLCWKKYFKFSKILNLFCPSTVKSIIPPNVILILSNLDCNSVCIWFCSLATYITFNVKPLFVKQYLGYQLNSCNAKVHRSNPCSPASITNFCTWKMFWHLSNNLLFLFLMQLCGGAKIQKQVFIYLGQKHFFPLKWSILFSNCFTSISSMCDGLSDHLHYVWMDCIVIKSKSNLNIFFILFDSELIPLSSKWSTNITSSIWITTVSIQSEMQY